MPVTHSLPYCRLANLIDVTLAYEDANSKLIEVVTVADVDDENRVGNSLLQILELRFDHKAKVLVKILKLKFRRDFEADIWIFFCC